MKENMMPRDYPDPHPHLVAGIADKARWRIAGKPIGTVEDVGAYMEKQGAEWTHDQGIAWVTAAEAMRAAGAGKGKSKATILPADPVPEPPDAPEPPAPVPAASPVPEAPAPLFAGLRHMQARPEKVRMEVMTVRVPEGLNERLDSYRMARKTSKQEVVSDVLDAFLTAQGF